MRQQQVEKWKKEPILLVYANDKCRFNEKYRDPTSGVWTSETIVESDIESK